MQNRNSFVLHNTLSQKSVKTQCVTALLQLYLPADNKLLPCLLRVYSLAEEKVAFPGNQLHLWAKKTKVKDTSTQRREISGHQFGILDRFIIKFTIRQRQERSEISLLRKALALPGWSFNCTGSPSTSITTSLRTCTACSLYSRVRTCIWQIFWPLLTGQHIHFNFTFIWSI